MSAPGQARCRFRNRDSDDGFAGSKPSWSASLPVGPSLRAELPIAALAPRDVAPRVHVRKARNQDRIRNASIWRFQTRRPGPTSQATPQVRAERQLPMDCARHSRGLEDERLDQFGVTGVLSSPPLGVRPSRTTPVAPDQQNDAGCTRSASRVSRFAVIESTRLSVG